MKEGGLRSVTGLWVVTTVASCALTVVSCAPSFASPVEAQLERGKSIYEQGCATEACHGTKGEGIASETGFKAWPTVGDDFQRRNPTAQVVFDVVRSGGERSLRALTDQQVYDSIAYELSLNGVTLAESIEADNAFLVSSGEAATAPQPGELYPPPGNATVLSGWSPPRVPAEASEDELRMRVTQIASAESVGRTQAPEGTRFVFFVLTFEALGDGPIDVGPEGLRLRTESGQSLEPQDIGLNYPVDRFHAQSIEPHYGTAAVTIFAAPENDPIHELVYTLPSGEGLVLELAGQ
jgi:hypothetical protein